MNWNAREAKDQKTRIPVSSEKETSALTPEITRELIFCASGSDLASSGTDSYSLIRGTSHSVMNAIQTNNLPLLPAGPSALHPPPVTLSLSYVFGYQTSSRRRTVAYCMDDYSRENWYYAGYATGKRRAVLICDRLGIVKSISRNGAEEKGQLFYEGHANKISCLEVHPLKRLVATGEAAAHPEIHVWDSFSGDPVEKLKTSHTSGVVNMAFDYLGELIASVGMNKMFSLEVVEWRTGRVLGFRNTSARAVVDLRFEVDDPSSVITCGPNFVEFFRVTSGAIQSVLNVTLESLGSPIVTCLEIVTFKVAKGNAQEVLVGTNTGDLVLVSKKGVQQGKEGAHSGSVNTVKMSCSLGQTIILISSGEDETVKLWSGGFEVIKVLDLRRLVLHHVPSGKSISAQSVDVHYSKEAKSCFMLPRVLVSTKNGEVMEVNIGAQGDGKEEEDRVSMVMRAQASQAEDKGRSEGMIRTFKYSTRQACAVHPKETYICIVSSDNLVCVWDYEKVRLVSELQMDSDVTCCLWHPDGEYLFMGNLVGEVQMFRLSVENEMMIKVNYVIELISTMKSASVASVVSMELTADGSLLAVSMGNSNASKEDSFVKVYIHKEQAEREGVYVNSPDTYLRYFEIRCPSIHANFEGSLQSFGMAVYFMSFSTDNRFLLCYFQLIDTNLKRNNEAQDGIYVLWDIKLNNTAKSWESQKEAVFSDVRFPNHINGKYRLFERDPGLLNLNEQNNQEGFSNLPDSSAQNASYSKICFSSSCRMPSGGHPTSSSDPLLLADTRGRLHCVALSSLSLPEGTDDYEYCRGWVIQAHSSCVDWVECSRDGHWAFTRGENDVGVCVWRVSMSNPLEELDHREFDINKEDLVFHELEPREKFYYLLNEAVPWREKAAGLVERVDQDIEGELYLRMKKVIGRRAFNRRNSLGFSVDNRLVFAAGSVVVELGLPPPGDILGRDFRATHFKQSFFHPFTSRERHLAPEISSMAMSPNGRTMCVGAFEHNVSITHWDITSRTYLGGVRLRGFCAIQRMVFAQDCRTIAVVCFHRKYYPSLQLIDIKMGRVMAALDMDQSFPGKIKGLVFVGNSSTSLVTLGVQHLYLWNLKGNFLIGRGLEVGHGIGIGGERDQTRRKGLVSDGNESEEDGNLSFLCGLFVDPLLIAGAEDGFVDGNNPGVLLRQLQSEQEGQREWLCACNMLGQRPLSF